MNISELSIRRPVLATVMTIIIVLFGVIGYFYIGVREYPSVDNPIISVSCSYAGANADVIENQITEPLEQNINGIPGIRSLTSVSQQGSSRITVEFELSVDLETAANDVRDKVSRAQRWLPRDCDPPTVSKADADAIIKKIPSLRIFCDEDDKMNLSLTDIGGEVLAISNFTLLGNCRRGNRPDFMGAEKPSVASEMYDYFVEKLRESVPHVATGIFGADMKVDICNDGPVTLILDSAVLRAPRSGGAS
jgi:D-tyrosyl-tRNA(Tyr) deacylase